MSIFLKLKRRGKEVGVNNSANVKSTNRGNEMYINAAYTKFRSKLNQRLIPLKKLFQNTTYEYM